MVSLLPANWEELARQIGALRKLRKDKCPSNYLRTRMLRFGSGHSVREPMVRVRRAQVADLLAVTLLERLRKVREWLRPLCAKLFREQGQAAAATDGFQVRVFDATMVQEPGPSASLQAAAVSGLWAAGELALVVSGENATLYLHPSLRNISLPKCQGVCSGSSVACRLWLSPIFT